MPFWETLKSLFARKPAPLTREKPAATATTAATKPLARMVNTITLSSDMETLYLIDNGRAIAFSLLDPRGVVIGIIGGQLSVASASAVANEPSLPGGDTGGGFDGGTGEAKVLAKPMVGAIKVPIAANKQWTITYNPGSDVVAIIGATDIDTGIAEPTETTSLAYAFKIGSKSINLRKNGLSLEAIYR